MDETTVETSGVWLPARLSSVGPGLVPADFAESVLSAVSEVEDPAMLWDGATSLAALAQKWNGHGAEKTQVKTAQMYVEIELGQRLGPNPGAGNRYESQDLDFAHEIYAIPAPRVSELQRFYGHRDMLIEAVREGHRSRRSLLLLVDRAEAAERPATVEADIDMRIGDFREVLDIEPRTVALILTDPPYPMEYLPLWSDLGKHGSQWLVDGGSLVAYCGQSILPDAISRLDEHLRYWWTLALINSAGSQMIPGKFVSAGWKPLLWYVKDRRRDKAMIPDRIAGSAPRKTIPTGDTDDWAQGVAELEPIISGLTKPGDLIVDPFGGSGTTGLAALRFGRKFIGATL